MEIILKCPNCGHEIESKEHAIDKLNAIVGHSNYDNPDEEVNGYRLWFRPYKESSNSLDVVGIAVAWPSNPGAGLPLWCVVAGSDTVQLMKRGEFIDSSSRLMWNGNERSSDEFVTAKREAMELLRARVLQTGSPE